MSKRSVASFYWLPKCSTCQKALAWLQQQGFEPSELIDIRTQKVPREMIGQLAQKVGGAEALFSKRALKYRAMGLHERTLSDDEMLDLMTEEDTFIRRPVLVTSDGKALCGWSAKQYQALLSP